MIDNRLRRICLALVLSALPLALVSCSVGAQKSRHLEQGGKFFAEKKYREAVIEYMNVLRLNNSNRLEALLRAGNLYLSLQDVIALALENNLDIETQRYGALIAEANIVRAQAGGALRGVTPSLQSGPTSAVQEISSDRVPTGNRAQIP